MAGHRKIVVLVMVLTGWAAAPARSDDAFLPDRDAPAPAAVTKQDWAQLDTLWRPSQVIPGMGCPAPAPNMAQAPQALLPVAASSGPPQFATANGQALAFMPPVPAMQPMPPRAQPMPQPVTQSISRMMGGDVCGRLLNRGRPLVNCHVVIVPLQESDGDIRVDADRKPLATVTDENGVFHFEDVPEGGYKLTWLPDGQRQWIRRIAMRPDVHVHNGAVTTLKEIRIALQTIN